MTEFEKLTQHEVDELMEKMVTLKIVSQYGDQFFFSKEFAKMLVETSIKMYTMKFPIESAIYTGAFMTLIRWLEPARMNDLELFMSVVQGILGTQNMKEIKQRIVDLAEGTNIPR